MKRSKHTEAQELLLIHLREMCHKNEKIVTEFRFDSERRFRFDVALPELMTGIEVDGGMWSGGHRHKAAIEKDYEKVNIAQAMGWKVFRFTNRQVLCGEAKQWLQKYL